MRTTLLGTSGSGRSSFGSGSSLPLMGTSEVVAIKAATPQQIARPIRHCIESTVPRREKLIPPGAAAKRAFVPSCATPHRMSFSRNVFCGQVAWDRPETSPLQVDTLQH